MDRGDSPSATICRLCEEPFTLSEDEFEGNLPRVLLCGHIYCTSCLQSIQFDSVIKCPECEVELTLPEGGVYGLQEDSRIIGLIYTAKVNKMKRAKNRRRTKITSTDVNPKTEEMKQPVDIEKIEKEVDDALARAAENLAQMEHIYETLTTGLAEQVERERARLKEEITRGTDKALLAVQKWKDAQMSQLTNLEAQFSTTQMELCSIQERMKALETAMQIAREVRRVPFLEQYCTLDKVLETLQAPVDVQSFNMNCLNLGSGLSCVFKSESPNQSLVLSLNMEVSIPKYVCRPRHRPNLSRHSSGSEAPDIIIEEITEDEEVHAAPPTGPELASDRRRNFRRRKTAFLGNKRIVTFWVVVTHIVNPCHFYIHYVAEKEENEILSKKIKQFCYRDECNFTFEDTVKTGSTIFGKWKDGLWCRASVVEIFQRSCVEAVKVCPVRELARIRLFFIDYGYMKTFIIQSDETTESSLKMLNNHLRKVDGEVRVELSHFSPQAIRCSLKDLVPHNPTKGWSKEAKVEFRRVVGTSAVELWPLSQDRDTLLVDLRKTSVGQSSDVPFSVREYLVLIAVARFYCPLTPDRKPLKYYPPVYPKINTEFSAVVCHINDPADFYISVVDNMEFLLLSSKLQDYYNTTTVTGHDDLSIYCPVIGQACVARNDDKLWYRAQVTGHPEARKVEVLNVDFGDKTVLSVSDLKKIKDEFFALPSKAIQCCLSDVIPLDGKTWSEACTNRFISLAHHKLCTVVVTGRVSRTEPLPIRLFESNLNGPNIAELLVEEELACFKDRPKHKHVSPPVDEPAIWDPPIELGSDQDAQGSTEQDDKLQPQLKLPAQLEDLKVRVCHINSPSSFYIQLTQLDSQLRRIFELMKQECSVMEPQDVVWKADMYCAAHINNVWERGQLCSDVTSSSTAEVRRCDYGNKVKLHVNNLRPLPSFLIGSLALECTLTDIRPAGGQSGWTATACDLLSYYLTGASAVMTIKTPTDERPVPVTLFCSNKIGRFVSVADFLVSEGLALRERKVRDAVTENPEETDAQSPLSETPADCSDGNNQNEPLPSPVAFPSLVFPPIPPKPATRIIMSVEKIKTELYQPPELPCLGHIQLNVSAIGEDGLIYVRTQNAESQLLQLRERIQQSMKTLPRQKPYTWKSVLGCSILGPDMLWHRGQLLEVQGGHVKVQYVDCGLVEDIPVVHVYPMLLCEDIPQLCVPCQLHGVSPVGGRWQRDAVALMREMLQNRCVEMQVMELPSDPRGPATVEFLLDGLSLSRILCHHKHVSRSQTVSVQGQSVMSPVPFLDNWDIDTKGLRGPKELMLGPFIQPNLPKEGEQFPVRVKHLCTPNELFLWPLEGTADVEVNGETLDEALTRINANINSLPQLTNFPPGAPCLAEYSDGNYYRAKLIKITSVDPVRILVQHVDFGSDDTLSTSKLRQMPAELLQFPSRAVKVKVAGFKATSTSENESVLPYSPTWSVKAAMAMIDLLHSSITASVVAQEPELMVLLYNEDGELVHLPLVHSGLAEPE
ncbi:RING finger protein 17 [Mastacembelus armatus]|uniref:RING finger protein 17 n=1 Tax=Mastacembelus armatus TaxID=205130 RepID=UPI000E455C32|nr:RING finger protein 17 [Mastacembelus armatus]